MANTKQTSKNVATKASKILRSSNSSKISKSVAGSALSQTKTTKKIEIIPRLSEVLWVLRSNYFTRKQFINRKLGKNWLNSKNFWQPKIIPAIHLTAKRAFWNAQTLCYIFFSDSVLSNFCLQNWIINRFTSLHKNHLLY